MRRRKRSVRPNRSGATESPRTPSRWSSQTANRVIIDEIVAAVASIPPSEVRGLSWNWGDSESGASKTYVEVTFNVDLDGLRRRVVCSLVVTEEIALSPRLETSSRRADRIIWRVREQLADHPTIGLVDSPADDPEDVPVSRVITR